MTKPVPHYLTPAQYGIARRVIAGLDAASEVIHSEPEEAAVRLINAQLQVAAEPARYTVAHLRGALGRRRRRQPHTRQLAPDTRQLPTAKLWTQELMELLPPVDEELRRQLHFLLHYTDLE